MCVIKCYVQMNDLLKSYVRKERERERRKRKRERERHHPVP